MTENTLKYFLALSFVKNLGHINAKKLIAAVGSIEALFAENINGLSKLKIRPSIIEDLISPKIMDKAQKEMDLMHKKGISATTYYSKEYPYRLKQCIDAPLVLYHKGKTNINSKKILSIVGTRRASLEGKDNCSKLIAELSSSDVTIVSGLALGIDSCAHRAAIENHLPTIAVLGHSLDHIYPPSNTELSKEIIKQGALITDFPIQSAILPGNFPSRNRIIAGISDATLVVESGIKGGSLITADIALSYDRDVMAFPSGSKSFMKSGGNLLIKENKAALIEGSQDLIKLLGWDIKNRGVQTKMFTELNKEEEMIANILREKRALRIDEISIQSCMPLNILSPILLQLEFKKVILAQPGNTYRFKG